MLEFDNLKLEMEKYRPQISELAEALHLDRLRLRVEELEHKQMEPGFWDDPEKSSKIVQEAGISPSPASNCQIPASLPRYYPFFIVRIVRGSFCISFRCRRDTDRCGRSSYRRVSPVSSPACLHRRGWSKYSYRLLFVRLLPSPPDGL